MSYQAPKWPAEEAARKVLDAVRNLNGDIDIPVDPIRVAREFGIDVYTSSLGSSLSGMIAKFSKNSGAEIILNGDQSAVRQRFTCAHELGHFFYNMTADGHRLDTYIHRRDELASCGVDSEEIYANKFAANLLMPEFAVRRFLDAGLDEIDIATRLRVSPESVGYRIRSLSRGRR